MRADQLPAPHGHIAEHFPSYGWRKVWIGVQPPAAPTKPVPIVALDHSLQIVGVRRPIEHGILHPRCVITDGATRGLWPAYDALKPLVRLATDTKVFRRRPLGATLLDAPKPALGRLKPLLDPCAFGPRPAGAWLPTERVVAIAHVVPEPVGGERMSGTVPDRPRRFVFGEGT